MRVITNEQRAIVRRLKGLDGSAGPAPGIPICDESGGIHGVLAPIDRALAADREVIEALTRWRNASMDSFQTRFTATAERTRRWLRETVLPDDTRVFFLIRDTTGRAVGNFGVRRISAAGAELDNLIRGERGGGPRLMHLSALTLAGWCFLALRVPALRAEVLSSNKLAVRFNEAAGLEVQGTLPLGVIREAGETHYVTHAAEGAAKAGIHMVVLGAERGAFCSRFPWLGSAGRGEAR